MQQVIGELLPLALGIAISPIPIIAIILMLITPKARSNGLVFLLGWMAGILIVGGIALVVADVAGQSTGSEAASQSQAVTVALATTPVQGSPPAGSVIASRAEDRTAPEGLPRETTGLSVSCLSKFCDVSIGVAVRVDARWQERGAWLTPPDIRGDCLGPQHRPGSQVGFASRCQGYGLKA